MKNRVIKEIIDWILVFVVAFGLALLIDKFIILNVDSLRLHGKNDNDRRQGYSKPIVIPIQRT